MSQTIVKSQFWTQNNEVRSQIDAWVDQFASEVTHFVTLTFDPKLIDAYISRSNRQLTRSSPELVGLYKRSMKHFLARLQKSLYGSSAMRYGSRMLFIGVHEGLKSGEVPHYHCLVGVSRDRAMHISDNTLRGMWRKVQFGGIQVNAQAYQDRGCLRYTTKGALLLDRENVDWENVLLPRRSSFPAE